MSIFSSYWGRAIGACLLSIAMLAAAPPAPAQPDSSGPTPDASRLTSFDIPAQNLATALTEFARQSNQELFYLPEMAEGKTTDGVTGTMTTSAAMDALLEGTGLEFEPTPNGSLLIGDRATLDARRAEWQSSAAVAGQQQQNTIGQRQPGIEEIIVTGQKREERIQDVPIAISAFSMEDLEAQKLEGGFDLLKAIPNVTFTKTNFTGYNFQIRGIGTQAISATTDPAVAVSQNDTTLIVNRLFEQEYLDVDRVEVLRGPQGTLYGRNATAGVINVIPSKPELGVWSGMLDVEVGNYNTRRLRGHFNMPLGDEWAIRGAYASTDRDGYATNEFNGNSIDGRDLWTGRITLGWQPTDRFRANLMWEHFEEDDNRLRSAKNLCHRDEGQNRIGGFDVTDANQEKLIRRIVQQGCLPGSLYSDGAYDTPNGDALPFVTVGRLNDDFKFFAASGGGIGPFGPLGLGGPPLFTDVDVYASRRQPRDLRTVYSPIEPRYQAESDIIDLSFDYQWTDSLDFKSHTVYVEDTLASTQDFTRFPASPELFNDINASNAAPAYADFAPDHEFCDPQLGCSSSLRIQDISQSESEQFNQQFQLTSSYAGDWNFSLGFNYTHFETTADYFVFSNALTALAQVPPFDSVAGQCRLTGEGCVSIQQGSLEEVRNDPYGHNFFLSRNPYELNSAGLFGETYWQATDTLKFTLGLRFTYDRKVFTPTPSQTLLADYRERKVGVVLFGGGVPSAPSDAVGPEDCVNVARLCAALGNAPGGRGYPAAPDIVQEWRVPTGRFVVDWSPALAFTDETLVYASFSHGYKGGGANPPSIAPPLGLFIEETQGAVSPKTFEPEYINAYEIGTKNTLFGGAATLNMSAFYYDYTDYQVSKIVDRSAANENFDAEVYGLELETIIAPSLNWQFNAAIGYLHTEVADGEQSIDLMDRTQGGNQFFITELQNPDYNGDDANARPRSEYVAAQCDPQLGGLPDCHAPADQKFLAFDDWVVLKPNVTQASNCMGPAEYLGGMLGSLDGGTEAGLLARANAFCPGGDLFGQPLAEYRPGVGAPNGGAGFFDDVGGNELPNSPHFTVSLGGQYSFDLTRDWRATARVDYYWQDESYARIYNTEYDRLKSWSNTNLSFWASNERWGVTVEAYVKNVFDETPITGTFLNSDDTGLTTNVFTLDPRLIGVSVRKEF